MVRIRGRALPSGEHVDLCADGDRWTDDPVPGAEVVEGWLLPGLVDAHTHPGAKDPGDPLDETLLREHLGQQLDLGVTAIRSPGLAGDPPPWFGTEPGTPRAFHAGPWIARHGQFFDEWGRHGDWADLPGFAAEQARRSGWAKIIADWGVDDEPVPADVMTAVVAAVHAVGGRVAVHTQHAAGSAAAVAAGVDSVEHGMWLDPALLDRMASQGTALTPTLSGFERHLPEVEKKPEGARKDWYVGGVHALRALVGSAHEAGVRILAGTDSIPHDRHALLHEIHALSSRIGPHEALGAASWHARTYLGLAGLEPGAPADAVVYAEDPRLDLDQLAHPIAVILRGERVR
ncbi:MULTISPECIES: amidohydrolase family protein [unclassified Saccharothrix]|uniref:amidohydrolase family protein n=1 Tax=unclassified Saccharothrix TaxID=2593673 RepID=UPI00307EA26F